MVCVQNICKYPVCSISRSYHKLVWVWDFSFSFSWQCHQSQGLIFAGFQTYLSMPPGLGCTQEHFYFCLIHVFRVYSCFLCLRNSRKLEITGKGNLLTPFPLSIDAKPSTPVVWALWECRTLSFHTGGGKTSDKFPRAQHREITAGLITHFQLRNK